MNRMDGKVCVVTGSTQGLGAAIARRLAEAGAAGLVTLGRNEAKGRAVAEAITRDTGVPVHFVNADLGKVEDCRTRDGGGRARLRQDTCAGERRCAHRPWHHPRYLARTLRRPVRRQCARTLTS